MGELACILTSAVEQSSAGNVRLCWCTEARNMHADVGLHKVGLLSEARTPSSKHGSNECSSHHPWSACESARTSKQKVLAPMCSFTLDLTHRQGGAHPRRK